ncbi:MAG: aspartyl protease family protein [Candidatus Shapirobacteria bacterium]
MGITNVNLKVSNLKDESRFIEENFLVDSGASLSVLPPNLAKKIGVKSTGEKRQFSLADGTIVEREIGEALFEFQNKRAPSLVIIGKRNDSPILGALTLESMGLVLDPFKRQLFEAKLFL